MFIKGSNNPANMFTKNLGNIKFSPSLEKPLGLSSTRYQGNQSDFMSYLLTLIVRGC